MELKLKYKNLQHMIDSAPLIGKWKQVLNQMLPEMMPLHVQNMLGLKTVILIKKTVPKSLVQIVDAKEIRADDLKMGNKGGLFNVLKIG